MSEELITLEQLKEYDQVRADNMVKKHTTTGSIDENLIFRATQHTFDYSESAFDGLFYEVTPFMESEQIPVGAKLIYNDNGTLKFTDSLPPYSGLQFGSPENVAANKEWFNGIVWMPKTVALSDFTYSTPTIKVGNDREVATQEVQSFVDYRENATDALLDLRSAETAAKLRTTESTLQASIKAETERATTAESTLQASIAEETRRATNAEGTLQTSIETEKERAENAESTLQASIAEETRRATTAETSLKTSIETETKRAKSVEATLQASIESETERATTAEGTKQDNLVSGTNIKTVNGHSLLGSGDLKISTITTVGTKGQVLTSNGDGTTGWKALESSFVPPIGMVVELKPNLNPNNFFIGDWVEI